MGLDVGEREAIQLALELGIGTVLIDDADGRQRAEQLHLEVRGTLGILERGAHLGKTNFRHALSKLEMSNFRLHRPTARCSSETKSVKLALDVLQRRSRPDHAQTRAD